jgi:hypothetical protein
MQTKYDIKMKENNQGKSWKKTKKKKSKELRPKLDIKSNEIKCLGIKLRKR